MRCPSKQQSIWRRSQVSGRQIVHDSFSFVSGAAYVVWRACPSAGTDNPVIADNFVHALSKLSSWAREHTSDRSWTMQARARKAGYAVSIAMRMPIPLTLINTKPRLYVWSSVGTQTPILRAFARPLSKAASLLVHSKHVPARKVYRILEWPRDYLSKASASSIVARRGDIDLILPVRRAMHIKAEFVLSNAPNSLHLCWNVFALW